MLLTILKFIFAVGSILTGSIEMTGNTLLVGINAIVLALLFYLTRSRSSIVTFVVPAVIGARFILYFVLFIFKEEAP